MTKPRTCVFCGVGLTRENRSKEHVFPQWLTKSLDVPADSVYYGLHSNIIGAQQRSLRKQGGETVQQGRVCSGCNSGWMSDLETSVGPTLSAMNGHKPLLLRRHDQSLLSLWFFKTLALYNITTNYRQLVSDADFQYIYEHQKVPPHVHVELGCSAVRSETAIHTRMSPINVVVNCGDTLRNGEVTTLLRDRSYVLTVHIGQILARVVGWPSEGKWLRLDTIGSELVRICPVQYRRVDWPLPTRYQHSDGMLSTLTFRVGLVRR